MLGQNPIRGEVEVAPGEIWRPTRPRFYVDEAAEALRYLRVGGKRYDWLPGQDAVFQEVSQQNWQLLASQAVCIACLEGEHRDCWRPNRPPSTSFILLQGCQCKDLKHKGVK